MCNVCSRDYMHVCVLAMCIANFAFKKNFHTMWFPTSSVDRRIVIYLRKMGVSFIRRSLLSQMLSIKFQHSKPDM